jgi:glycosyltransferase involved in cell wall biosynthesis
MSQRLGILASHPIQYYAPLYRELARHVDLHVYYSHRQTAEGQAAAGFGIGFEWDIDLLSGYSNEFLSNVARRPDVSRFLGCDNPAISGKIRAGGYDAFLVMGWYLKAYWQAIRACRRNAVPVLVRGDSRLGTSRSWLKSQAKAIVYPRLLRQFDACLYVGRDSRDYFAHYGVPDSRLFFAPHCVDNDRFAAQVSGVARMQARRNLAIPVSGKIALFVGKLVDNKRPLDLVDASAIMNKRGVPVQVVIAGDGPMRGKVEAAARSRGVSLTLLGFRNQSELPAIYRAADVLVLPSASETWGLAANEALACGTPVIVSDRAGCARDLVSPVKTGAVYPMGVVTALADALRSVLAEPPSETAIRDVICKYSPRASALGIVEAVRWLHDGQGYRR